MKASFTKSAVGISSLLFFSWLAGCTPAQARPPATTTTAATPRPESVGKSPWGPHDEMGALNMMTPESRTAVLARLDVRKVYDLATDYFQGMPSFDAFGDPHYQIWMTHTPRGTGVDDPAQVGHAHNDKVSYTGDAISMYTHTGTHIDALNHFGLDGEVYNGVKVDEHLGDHGWKRNGVDKMPPIIARGVLVDVAAAKGVAVLPNSYAITLADLQAALARQATTLQEGDVVLIRTGRMSLWPDRARYGGNEPGLTFEAARWLAEDKRAMVIGSDAFSPEPAPSPRKDNWLPIHTYLLAQRGVPIIEVINLEELARDRTYEFAFIAAPLRLRGASASPFRPIAIPFRR